MELDIRKQCIDEGWPIRPYYDINDYRMFYFYHDMETIMPRFTESDQEIYDKKKRALRNNSETDNTFILKEIRDYLPHNTAIRIRDFITISVKIEGQAPDLKLDEEDFIKIRRVKYKTQQERIKAFEN
jgi:hypothetical protein